MPMTAIPVIDLAPHFEGTAAERQSVAQQIDRACREIGFFLITGHGVATDTIEQTYAMASGFFDLPVEEKLKIRQPAANISRGYTPFKGETLAASLGAAAPADLKEMIDMGPVDVPGGEYYERAEAGHHFHPNLWPADPPGFRLAMERYYRRANRLANDLMSLFALALDLPENFFLDKLDKNMSALRVIRYPEQHEAPLPGQLRSGAHTDYGTLTILMSDRAAGGLQAQHRDGYWVDIVTVANNHAVDYGWPGLFDTRAGLEQAGLVVLGVGEDAARAMRPVVQETAGLRVGVIAFSCLTPTGMGASARRPGISAIHVQTGYEIDPWYQMEEPGDPSVVRIRTAVRPDDLAVAVAAVAELRLHCDLLVVTIHWGFGSGEDLAEYQLPLGRALIDAGADVVHGHHPHAIHAIGAHRGKPILFSTGTFIGQQIFLPAPPAVRTLWAGMSPDGYVAELRLEPGAAGDIVLHPTTLDADRLPRIATGADFDRIAARLARLSAPFGVQVLPEGGTLRVSLA